MRYDVSLGFEAPIEFHKGEKGYFYSDENYTIKKVPLGSEDLEALRFAAQTLYQFRDIPVFQAFEQMLGKLRENVSLSENEFDTGFMDHMLFEESDKSQGDRYIPDILKAIREHREIVLNYSFHSSDKNDKDYVLQPYLLKQFRLRWYLIAKDKRAGKVKTFGLDRVVDTALSEDLFSAPSFDAKEYFRDTYGISHMDEDPVMVKLEIDRPQSKYFLSMPMHHSLEKIGEAEGVDIIQMKVVINQDLVNQLMAWMPNIKVMEPEALRKQLINRCKEAVKKNISAT